MKKIIFILIINSSFLVVNAQENNDVVKGETLNCRTEPSKDLNFDNNEKQFDSMEAKKGQETATKTPIKNKKHFIKKVFSNFQGADIKDAWSLLSIN